MDDLNLIFSMQLSKSAREVSKFASVALVDIDITFIPSTVFFFNAHHMKMDFGYPSPLFLFFGCCYYICIYIYIFNKTLAWISWLHITIWVHGLSSRNVILYLFWEIIHMITVFYFIFSLFIIKLFQQLSWMSKKPFLILLTSSMCIIYKVWTINCEFL